MSEVLIESHSSPIKTPQQLLVVIALSFIVPITIIVLLTQLVTSGPKLDKGDPGMSDEAIARRIKPVGEVVIVDANAPKVEKTGKEVVDAVCSACHATGALNAPKMGDKAAWGKLIKEGHAGLTKEAIKGVRQMPPRGGNPDLSDTEIARAVAYMANQAGANFKEPEAPKPAAGAPAPATAPAVPAAGASTTPPATASATPAAAAPAAAGAKTAAASGKSVYEATCSVCHAQGVAGAPKAGEKAAWAPRTKTGMPALYASALKGKNAMPPKGGNMSLSDAEVKAAVDYMVGLAK
jgi:cytochrome c5